MLVCGCGGSTLFVDAGLGDGSRSTDAAGQEAMLPDSVSHDAALAADTSLVGDARDDALPIDSGDLDRRPAVDFPRADRAHKLDLPPPDRPRKPDARQRDARQPDVAQPDARRPDARMIDARVYDTRKPDTRAPDQPRPPDSASAPDSAPPPDSATPTDTAPPPADSAPPPDRPHPPDSAPPPTGAVVADHIASRDFARIPREFVDLAKQRYRVLYGHTSHGSQITTGMEMLAGDPYTYNSGPGSLSYTEIDGDLGHNGDLTWAETTRDWLSQPGQDFTLVLWSWCLGMSDNTPDGVSTYLGAMGQLEADYPGITFVYMTGHTDNTSPEAHATLRRNNQQVRSYCRTHGKVLFDFEDIESWDPGGTYYPDTGDDCAWCQSWCDGHPGTCPGCGECQHSHCLNCLLKGKAFWWMLARLAGWSGQ